MSNTATLPGLPSAPVQPARATTIGRKNIYICKTCGHGVVTQDVAAGTTPFAIRCDHPECHGYAFSLFYGALQALSHKAAKRETDRLVETCIDAAAKLGEAYPDEQ